MVLARFKSFWLVPQVGLVSKDITSNIDHVSILSKESTEYELKVKTLMTLAREQIFIEMFVLMLASFYVY